MSDVEYVKNHKVITVKPVNTTIISNGKVIGDHPYKAVIARDLYNRLDEISGLKGNITANRNDIVLLQDDLRSEIDIRISGDTSINARVDDVEAGIQNTNQLIIDESGARATEISGLNVSLGNRITSEISTVNQAIVDETQARTQQGATIRSEFDNRVTSEVDTINQTISTNQSATASSITNLRADMVQGDASINDGLYGTAGTMTSVQSFIGLTPGSSGLKQDIDLLKKQNDGKIETTSGTHDVITGTGDTAQFFNTATPYVDWLNAESANSTDIRDSHVGDVYIKYTTLPNGGKEYISSHKFIRTEPDATSPYSTDPDGFTWALITDDAAKAAYEAALDAIELAGGKISSFYFYSKSPTGISGGTASVGTYSPTATAIGDSWYDPDRDMAEFRWDGVEWQDVNDRRVQAHAQSLTNIDAYLKDSGGTIGGADSQVVQKIVTEADRVESKFEYNTNVNLNGFTYNSGFGLKTLATGGDGSEGNPFDSEFWINAEKFKFTNSSATGSVKPFTIDASGEVPNIYFDGIVNFGRSNVVRVNGKNIFPANYAIANTVPPSPYVLENTNLTIVGGVYELESTSDTAESYIAFCADFDSLNIPLFPGTDSEYILSFNTYLYTDNSPVLVDNISVEVLTPTDNEYGETLSIPIYGSRQAVRIKPGGDSADKCLFKLVNNTNSGNGHTKMTITNIMFERVPYSSYNHAGFVFPTESYLDVPIGTTTIDAGTITTNSITAEQIKANSVSADRLSSTNGVSTVWTGGGLISATFDGNPDGDIGTPTAGFRLSSNATGSSSNPNIYGAYIQASTLDASGSFVVSSQVDSTKTGNAIHTVRGGTGRAYGADYGTGHLNARLCKSSSYLYVQAKGRQHIHEDHPSTSYLQYSISGGDWVNLDSAYQSSSGGDLDYRLNLEGVIEYSTIPIDSYIDFRTTYSTNGSTSFTSTVITSTVYNV